MTLAQPESGRTPAFAVDEQTEEAALWAAFSSARSGDAAAGPWTALQARRLPGIRACGVFRTGASGLELVAAWPDTETLPSDLHASAILGVEQRITMVRSAGRGFHLICPLPGDDGWVACAEVTPMPAPALQQALDTLHWGIGWLQAARASGVGQQAEVRNEWLELAARLAENVARERDAPSASRALAAGIGAAFGASAVSVGVLRRGTLSVMAQWKASRESTEGEDGEGPPAESGPVDIAAALHSALEAGRSMRVDRHEADADAAPEQSPAPIELLANRAHVCALPLPGPEVPAGAMLIERAEGAPFTDDEVASLETIALQAAPLIDAKPLARPVPVTRERRAFVALFGPVRMKLKLALIALLTAGLVMLGATGRYEVAVDGAIEGAPPRVLSAPFGGVLGQVLVRRGDAVKRGQLVARMDDRELRLERDRLDAERTQLELVTREAREIRDRAATESLDAKLKDVEARLRTVDERLARTRVTSPLDGIVVGGAGLNAAESSVDAGQSLVEVVPMDSYRLVLWVDERDLALLREGQAGMLALSGESTTLPFTIKRLTGVAAPGHGRSRIRVEAQLQDMNERASPGVEGTGRVDVGKRKLVWIWWRDLQRSLESSMR